MMCATWTELSDTSLFNWILIPWVPLQEFDDPRDAEDAVYEMNGRDFMGERLLAQHHAHQAGMPHTVGSVQEMKEICH